jgi:xanthine dehydrogenase small subunit
VLREDLVCTGTKEGCGEGDCGACTVVLGEVVGGQLTYKAINSCIRLAHSVDGMAVYTWKTSPRPPDGTLHPAQEAMVQCHGSQCGFCTPGFVMSLFGMYQNTCAGGKGITGNRRRPTCRATCAAAPATGPSWTRRSRWAASPCPPAARWTRRQRWRHLRTAQEARSATRLPAPHHPAALLQARAAHPKAQVVAGTTDVGLWVTKMHQALPQVLDVTAARELRRVETYPHHIAIGAAVTLTEAFAALVPSGPSC